MGHIKSLSKHNYCISQFTMAISSKLQFPLVGEAGRRGILAVLFDHENGPVWIGILIGVTITVLIVFCLKCCRNMDEKKEYRIRKRLQNQTLQADPAYPTPGFDARDEKSPIIKKHQYYPEPYKIDMSNQTSSGDFPPSYQQATRIHAGFDARDEKSPIIKKHQYYPEPYKIDRSSQTRSWDFPPNYQQATNKKEKFQCAFSVCEGDMFLSMEDKEKHMLGIHGVLEDDITSKDNVDQDLDVDDVIDGACGVGYISMSQMATAQGTQIFIADDTINEDKDPI